MWETLLELRMERRASNIELDLYLIGVRATAHRLDLEIKLNLIMSMMVPVRVDYSIFEETVTIYLSLCI